MPTRAGTSIARVRWRAVLLASCVALTGLAVGGEDEGTDRPAMRPREALPHPLERVAVDARLPAQSAAPVAAVSVAPAVVRMVPGLAAELDSPVQVEAAAPVAPRSQPRVVQAALVVPLSTQPPSEPDAEPSELRIAALDDAAPIPVAAPLELRLVPTVLDAGPTAPTLAEVELEPRLEDPAPAELAAIPALPAQFTDESARPAPALAVSSPAPSPVPEQRARVAQISDTARTAYIAQIGAEISGQRLAVRAGGEVLGAVQFQVADGRVSVHIGQVLDLFEDRMDTARFAALRSSPAAREFVSLDQVRKAGIPLQYDAVYDELVLDAGKG